MLDHKVCAFDPETGEVEVVLQLKDRPSGLGFLPDGRLLVATMGERKLLRLDADGLNLHADLASVTDLLNDMVTGPDGRSYLDARFGGSDAGGLILVEQDGAHRVVAGGMGMPNGLAITQDGRTLVVNDLFARRIEAFDIAPDGSLTNRRLFADLGDASPDGLCLDAEGAAWVGLPVQAKFVRIKPGGEITHEIAYVDKWGVAPALGGRDRRTLFLCTARVTLAQLQSLLEDTSNARAECRGWIEAVGPVSTPGAGWP